MCRITIEKQEKFRFLSFFWLNLFFLEMIADLHRNDYNKD